MPSKKNQDQVKNVELYKSYDQFNVKERWSKQAIEKLFDLPFNDLLFQAHTIHRQNFDANTVQLSTLLSIKTGDVLRIVATALNPHVTLQKLKIHLY